MELAGSQRVSINLLVSDNFLGAELLYFKFSQNYGIVLAKIKRIYTAPYCASHVILFRHQNTLRHIVLLILAGIIMKLTLANFFWTYNFLGSNLAPW